MSLIPGKGRGLVIEESLPAGTLLFVEKAFLTASSWHGMLENARRKLFDASDVAGAGDSRRLFFDLSQGTAETETHLISGKGGEDDMRKTYQEECLAAVLNVNVHAMTHVDEAKTIGRLDCCSKKRALYLFARYMNHAALPNVNRIVVWEKDKARAVSASWDASDEEIGRQTLASTTDDAEAVAQSVVPDDAATDTKSEGGYDLSDIDTDGETERAAAPLGGTVWIIVRACRDIESGTELCDVYCSPLQSSSSRDDALKSWGFRCLDDRTTLEREVFEGSDEPDSSPTAASSTPPKKQLSRCDWLTLRGNRLVQQIQAEVTAGRFAAAEKQLAKLGDLLAEIELTVAKRWDGYLHGKVPKARDKAKNRAGSAKALVQHFVDLVESEMRSMRESGAGFALAPTHEQPRLSAWRGWKHDEEDVAGADRLAPTAENSHLIYRLFLSSFFDLYLQHALLSEKITKTPEAQAGGDEGVPGDPAALEVARKKAFEWSRLELLVRMGQPNSDKHCEVATEQLKHCLIMLEMENRDDGCSLSVTGNPGVRALVERALRIYRQTYTFGESRQTTFAVWKLFVAGSGSSHRIPERFLPLIESIFLDQ